MFLTSSKRQTIDRLHINSTGSRLLHRVTHIKSDRSEGAKVERVIGLHTPNRTPRVQGSSLERAFIQTLRTGLIQ